MAESRIRAWVLNGPNLDLLGTREPHLYGPETLASLEARIAGWAEELDLAVACFQTGFEGELIALVHRARQEVDFLVLNPAALTHTSVALREALSAVALPAYEVHLTNLAAREAWRRHSWISAVCQGTVSGFGALGYRLALEAGATTLGRAGALEGPRQPRGGME